MAITRRISETLVSAYVKPRVIKQFTRQLVSVALVGGTTPPQVRREIDRRCGVDRRQQQRPVLMDMRSAYARRISNRRDHETLDGQSGIDTYA